VYSSDRRGISESVLNKGRNLANSIVRRGLGIVHKMAARNVGCLSKTDPWMERDLDLGRHVER
jgi:hypothetical protein